MNNRLHRKCPLCKRWRKWTVPPNHIFATGYHWEKINNQWICYWCYARSLNKENELRKLHKELRKKK